MYNYQSNDLVSCTNINVMSRNQLGEFEEVILLTVASLQPAAYGVSISTNLTEVTGRNADMGAVHSVLRRLEAKGFVRSEMGGATTERGGRRKRLFEVTSAGKGILDSNFELRSSMYAKISNLSFK